MTVYNVLNCFANLNLNVKRQHLTMENIIFKCRVLVYFLYFALLEQYKKTVESHLYFNVETLF